MACCECSLYLKYQKIDEILDIDLSANRKRYRTRNPGLEKKSLFSKTNIERE